jgi:hypothetical protein
MISLVSPFSVVLSAEVRLSSGSKVVFGIDWQWLLMLAFEQCMRGLLAFINTRAADTQSGPI